MATEEVGEGKLTRVSLSEPGVAAVTRVSASEPASIYALRRTNSLLRQTLKILNSADDFLEILN